MSTRPVTTILDGRRPVLSNLNPIGHVFVVFAKIGIHGRSTKAIPERLLAFFQTTSLPADAVFLLEMRLLSGLGPRPRGYGAPSSPQLA